MLLTKPIFETLPIAIIAASILLMLFLHTPLAFIVGGVLILASVDMLYRRLTAMGTDPDVMDYVDTANESF